jgi:hypothetical protein
VEALSKRKAVWRFLLLFQDCLSEMACMDGDNHLNGLILRLAPLPPTLARTLDRWFSFHVYVAQIVLSAFPVAH